MKREMVQLHEVIIQFFSLVSLLIKLTKHLVSQNTPPEYHLTVYLTYSFSSALLIIF